MTLSDWGQCWKMEAGDMVVKICPGKALNARKHDLDPVLSSTFARFPTALTPPFSQQLTQLRDLVISPLITL